MKNLFHVQLLKDISIAKKLYFIVGTMAVLIVVELLTLWFAIHILSSVRAFVGAEGLWSKAQKDGVYQLRKYTSSHNEADYNAFQKFMSVPLGDHKTRMELLKSDPDLNIARQGFLEGRIHPNDIDGMINLVRNFHSIYFLNKAINIWAKGDTIIGLLLPISEEIHHEIISSASREKLDTLIAAIDPINQQLTKLEDDFSYTLGEGSRWLENVILKLVFIVALTVEITGLVLTISVSRGITKGLNEINRATTFIAKGDLSERAAVFSKDEIGRVAIAVNQMTEQLTLSYKEVEQFAYVASHDLQEPLRTISNYVGLFRKKYKGQIDEESDKYLDFINRATVRMQSLIKDLLDYSRIGHDKSMTTIDCNKILHDVLNDMETSIKESSAKIYAEELPVIRGYQDLKSLFQNLISNAIKYRKKDVPVIINISVNEQEREWLFSVKDNGIGIDKIHHERIFVIFQKLHTQKQYTGTGIGLSLCKKIVELHSGKMWVESEPEKGSIFYFTISKSLLHEKKAGLHYADR
jgi:signal transduction histidine kinase